MCRFTIKATRSYRLPPHRGSHKEACPRLSLLQPREKVCDFLFPTQTWLGNSLRSLALANDAFPEENARLSQNLGMGKKVC